MIADKTAARQSLSQISYIRDAAKRDMIFVFRYRHEFADSYIRFRNSRTSYRRYTRKLAEAAKKYNSLFAD
jgi:hypothetical protein